MAPFTVAFTQWDISLLLGLWRSPPIITQVYGKILHYRSLSKISEGRVIWGGAGSYVMVYTHLHSKRDFSKVHTQQGPAKFKAAVLL